MTIGDNIITIIKSLPIGFAIKLFINFFEPLNLVTNWSLFIIFLGIFIYCLRITKNMEEDDALLLQLIIIYPLTHFFDNLIEFYF